VSSSCSSSQTGLGSGQQAGCSRAVSWRQRVRPVADAKPVAAAALSRCPAHACRVRRVERRVVNCWRWAISGGSRLAPPSGQWVAQPWRAVAVYAVSRLPVLRSQRGWQNRPSQGRRVLLFPDDQMGWGRVLGIKPALDVFGRKPAACWQTQSMMRVEQAADRFVSHRSLPVTEAIKRRGSWEPFKGSPPLSHQPGV
jgi:hypothetical protein